jgi:hypothetical protein
MRHFDDVMADVAQYISQELFTELMETIIKEVEELLLHTME